MEPVSPIVRCIIKCDPTTGYAAKMVYILWSRG